MRGHGYAEYDASTNVFVYHELGEYDASDLSSTQDLLFKEIIGRSKVLQSISVAIILLGVTGLITNRRKK